jgi:hypothetical protein
MSHNEIKRDFGDGERKGQEIWYFWAKHVLPVKNTCT